MVEYWSIGVPSLPYSITPQPNTSQGQGIVKRIVIDTDAGVDDALAIIFAFRSPEIHVEAITTVSGNVHVDLCTENVLRVLDVLDLDDPPPVAKGEAEPLSKRLLTAPEVHGVDGLGGLHDLMEETGALRYARPIGRPISKRAWELLAELGGQTSPTCQTSQTGLTLITIGPLTNVAKAIIEHPSAMKGYREVICMGGAFQVNGNTTPVAEFNIFVDPHAAQVVLDSGIPMTFVPLDVTEQVCLEMGHVTREIHPLGTRLSQFIADVTRGIVDYHMRTEGFPGCYLHDPLAVGIAIDPSFCGTREAFVQVVTEGTDAGKTVARPTLPNARVCTEVDAARFVRFFLDRVTG